MAKRRTPWTPIFNPDPRYGAVAVGSTPATAPGLPAPVILYDTRNYDGMGVIENEGTGGAVWDLPLGGGSGFWYGRKTKSWPSISDAGASFPSGWDDFGGDFCSAGVLHVTAIPNAMMHGAANIWSENEWYIQEVGGSDLAVGVGAYADYFDWGSAPGSFFGLYANDNDSYFEWNPTDEFYSSYTAGATGPMIFAGSLLVTYMNVISEETRVWVVDGNGPTLLVNFTGSTDDGTAFASFAGACNATDWPSNLQMFWSLGYHTGPEPSPGVQWNGVIGQALYRTNTTPTDDELSAFYSYWFDDADVQELDTLFVEFTVDDIADIDAEFEPASDEYRVVVISAVTNRITTINSGDPTAMSVDFSLQTGLLAGCHSVVWDQSAGFAFVTSTDNDNVISFDTFPASSISVNDTQSDATLLVAPEAMIGFGRTDQKPGSGLAVVASGYLTLLSESAGNLGLYGGINVGARGRPHWHQPNDNSDNIIYVGNATGLSAVNVSTVAIPTEDDTLAHANLEDIDDIADRYALTDEAVYLFTVSSANSTMAVVDITNPTGMEYVTALTGLSSAPSRIYVWGKRALLFGASQMQIVDITDPTSPTLLSTHSINGGGGAQVYGDLIWTGGSGISSYSLVGGTP